MVASGSDLHDGRNDPMFLGAWSLVSYAHVLVSGEVTRPYGDSPLGQLVYEASGYMSAQLSVGEPARLASSDSGGATEVEAAKAWRGYFGYWGTYRVEAEAGVVLHRVEGSSFPNWIGTEQRRQFRFESPDRLILEMQAQTGRYTLVWQRKIDAGHAGVK